MPANETNKVPTLSHSARIHQIENNIDRRRHLIDQHASALTQGLRQAITSPAALLTFAGLGFVAGLVLGRKPKVVVIGSASAQAAYKDAGHSDRLGRLIAQALKIAALVRTVTAFLPAAPTPPPQTSTGTPPQRPR